MSQSIVTKVNDRDSGVLEGICTKVRLNEAKAAIDDTSPIKYICVSAYCMHYEVVLTDVNEEVIDTICIPLKLSDDIFSAIATHKTNLDSIT